MRNLVVWASGDNYDAHLFTRLRVLGANLVFFDRMVPDGYADFVGTDNDHAMRSLVEHALAHGAERFLFVGYEDVSWDTYTRRREAFLQTCREKRLPARCVAVPWRDQAARVLARHGRDLAPALEADIAMPVIRDRAPEWFPPDGTLAVIAVNDYVALQVRIVRPDLLVCGIDGLAEAVQHGICTYRHPMQNMAREAVRMLRDQQRLGRSWRAEQRTLKGELVPPA
jgi:DNA-binding LacI/PurR family transcriptional regulator